MAAQVNVSRWQPHVEAAMKAGVSFSAYARAHGMSRHTLYATYKALKLAGIVPGDDYRPPTIKRDEPKTAVKGSSSFIPVCVSGADVALTIQLPTGVVLQFSRLEPSLWPLLIQLSGLPCSR